MADKPWEKKTPAAEKPAVAPPPPAPKVEPKLVGVAAGGLAEKVEPAVSRKGAEPTLEASKVKELISPETKPSATHTALMLSPGTPVQTVRVKSGIPLGGSMETTLDVDRARRGHTTKDFSMALIPIGVLIEADYVSRDNGKRRHQSVIVPWSNIEYAVLDDLKE